MTDAQPAGGAQPGEAPGEQAPKKKKKRGCILAACGSCLGLTVLVCGFGGYLLYLEEGVSYSDPGDEVKSIPIRSGEPFEVTFEWDDFGYAKHGLYVDLGEGATTGRTVSGDLGCREWGELRQRPVTGTYWGPPDDEHMGWVRMTSTYNRSSSTPVTCRGTLRWDPPVSGVRLVVTRRQRPSDWLAGF